MSKVQGHGHRRLSKMAWDKQNYWSFNILYLILVFPVSIALLLYFRNRRHINSPPCYSGWIPWLGCAIEFGKEPLYFIEKCRRKLGPIFTLKVAGKRLTFITEPDDYKHFFQSPNVDFQIAVQDAVEHTASITAASFFENHTKLHDTVKARLAPIQLDPFCLSLQEKFGRHLGTWDKSGTEKDLAGMVRNTMYKTVLENLFGEAVLPLVPEIDFQLFEKHFVKFDDDFEYGSQLPPMFLKDWSKAKNYLLNVFHGAVKKAEHNKSTDAENQTLFESILKTVDRANAPNFGLLMMWASLANAIPITFWTLAFITSSSHIAQRVKAEIRDVLGDKKSGVQLTQSDLQRLPLVKRCILEAIRMRSPGVITRGVAKDIQIGSYTVPAGDMLMLSPYWSHRHPRYFPEPETFNPDRWESADLEKNVFLEGFIAFGGGRYQCPGRWFALLEMHLFVTMVLHQFDITPLGPVPLQSPLHLVGTQQPMSQFLVNYQRLC